MTSNPREGRTGGWTPQSSKCVCPLVDELLFAGPVADRAGGAE